MVKKGASGYYNPKRMISKETLSSHSLGTSTERSPTKCGQAILKPVAAELLPASPNQSVNTDQKKKTTGGDEAC